MASKFPKNTKKGPTFFHAKLSRAKKNLTNFMPNTSPLKTFYLSSPKNNCYAKTWTNCTKGMITTCEMELWREWGNYHFWIWYSSLFRRQNWPSIPSPWKMLNLEGYLHAYFRSTNRIRITIKRGSGKRWKSTTTTGCKYQTAHLTA